MSHVDDGKLNALLDGEMDSAEAALVEAHIAGCPECATRLEEAKRFLSAAADLLGALDVPKSAAAPGAPRRVTKTAQEAALDLDAATQQSPAIGEPAGPLFHRAPRPQPERRHFDYTSLAWAATIVLAIGVGYLANEVRHAGGGRAPGERGSGPQQAVPTTTAANAPAADKAASAVRRESEGTAAGGQRLAAGRRPNGPPAAKAPPGEGTPVVAGRSATGLGHKRLERPAQRLVAASSAPARPTPLASVVTAPAAAGVALGNEPARRRAAPPAEAAGAGALQGAPRSTSRFAAAGPPAGATEGFRRASLEDAVTRLHGTIRLIDGMHSDRVEVRPGSQVLGADSGRDVVRVVYGAAGHEVVLEQQRILAPDGATAQERQDAQPSNDQMGYGDTLMTTAPDGDRRLRWLDRDGFWLSLSGRVPVDSLRALAVRVR